MIEKSLIKVTMLGTGTSSGVPVLTCSCSVCTSLDAKDTRTRTSLHLQSATTSIVIDTGPDFRAQALCNKIEQVDAVVFTHEHKDHTAGLDDVRPYNYLRGKKSIPIYARKQVLEQLKKEFYYAFAEEKYPGVPILELIEIQNQPFQIGDIILQPIELLHHKLAVFGFRINDFVYITDANWISDDEKLKTHSCKILILNALQREKHISHFNLEEAISLAQEINPEQTYFTHIAHKLGTHKQVSKELPSGINLGYDGLSFMI